jgi:uncharacterized paraquat-inducible protein A
VKDAHSRRSCRHENGTELWACCDCDCTKKLEERLATQGEAFCRRFAQGRQGAAVSSPPRRSKDRLSLLAISPSLFCHSTFGFRHW